jgi:two-component system, OmpR family, KDP operon response regulator KdpE
MRILLVEDDRELRQTLRDALAVEGHTPRCAASLADARAQWQHAEHTDPAQRPDLVLLDLGLPDGEGAELLALIRQQRPGVPVIVLSARADEPGKIALLDAGADDYLVKPFSIGELLARMRVAWRHRGRHAQPALTRYEREGLWVDLAAHRVVLDGVERHLTPTEFSLLARLVRSAGQVVTHRQLLADVWGAEHVASTHYLRLYMGQLRAKLEPVPAEPRWLLTEVGVGYRLVEPDALMRS